MKPLLDGEDFTFVYKFFFKELDIFFPLTSFEFKMLTIMNEPFSKLHLHSWTFLKTLQTKTWTQSWLDIFEQFLIWSSL